MVNLEKCLKPCASMDNSTEDKQPISFQSVKDPTVLISVLAERLPISSMIYNQVIMYKKHVDDLTFHILGSEINSSTWIVSVNVREDYGIHFGISAPVPVALGKEQVAPEITQSFSSGGLIDWENLGGNVMTFFVQMPKPVSNMIFDISTSIKGMVTEAHPCLLYTMDREEALKLQIDLPTSDPSLKVRRLTATKSDADFILSTWKYTLPGSEKVLLKCLERNASAGMFVKNGNGEKCVCGVYIPAIGLLSALYTLKEYRKKGFAKVTMKYAFREYAKDGCIPCLTVELQNPRSIQFHESLGMKQAGLPVNFLIVKKLEID